MRKTFAVILAASLAIGSIFLSTGCMRAAQRATQRAVESAVERELAKEGITIEGDGEEYTLKAETDDGTSEMRWGSTELPDNIPSDVQIYPDINIVFSAKETRSSDEDTREMVQVIAQSKDSLEKVLDWHTSRYEGWDEFSTMSWSSDDGQAHMLSAQKGSWSDDAMLKVDMVIGEDDGMTQISYAIEARKVK